MKKKSRKRNENERRNYLTLKLSIFVLIIFFASEALIFGGTFIITSVVSNGEASFAQTLSVIIASLLVGALLSIIVSNIVLKPLNTLISATKYISQGEFSRKVEISWREKYSVKEVNQLINSFNHMADELQRNEIFRKDFISNFSHEFKTPLASIRGFAQQLYNGDLTPEQQKEFSKIILEETEYLSKLSTDTLLLTSLENQNIVTEKTEFSLDEQLRTCMLALEPIWAEKKLDIDMELQDIVYYQNASLLGHIWANLIDNAVKFTPENGSVTVSCEKKEKSILVKISDTGRGIEADKLDFIFDKFYQCDQSHATKGNGLGLSLVKRIVDLCGGTISVESEVGKGTTFSVSLPL